MTVNASSNKFQEEHTYRLTGETSEPLIIKITAKPAIKKTIVPVIFIPGIFGSRLENQKGTDEDSCYIWDPNRTSPLMRNYAKGLSSIFVARHWEDDEINTKVTRLHNEVAMVMKDHRNDGKTNRNDFIIIDILRSRTFSRLTKQYDFKTMKGNEWIYRRSDGEEAYTDLAYRVANDEYERRSKRGWYGVLDEYDPLLKSIHELKDNEFIYPVYAFGYDWRYDLNTAAEKLREKINEVLAIQDYPDFGEQGKEYEKVHPKVIIVTHSQGSMVARYALKKLGAEGNVQAVIHLNQPTTGAPVLYRRFITGTSPERSFFGFSDKIFNEILGNNPYHFTRMAAPLTGALSLLPTNDYIVQAGQADEYVAADVAKHQWLRHEDPRLQAAAPVKDVYDDLYLSEKHGLINCKRYDAAGNPNPYQESEFDIVQSTFEAGGEIKTHQQPRHTLAPGELEELAELIKLKKATILPPPADNPYRRDNQRLRPHDGLDDKTYGKAVLYWENFEENIKKAQNFHADLGLAQHDNTHVIRARGVATVTYVKFKLDAAHLLKCELERTYEGDGTVPLSSQEALIHHQCAKKPAKAAGPIIQKGKHADICTHAEAMKAVKALLTGELVAEFRIKAEVKPS